MAALVARYFNNGVQNNNSISSVSSTTHDQYEELGAQCARALRNLSVHPINKEQIVKCGASDSLLMLATSSNDRVSQQARRALKNIENVMNDSKDSKNNHK